MAASSSYLIPVRNSFLRDEVEHADILILCTVIAELFGYSNKESPKIENPEADAARITLESIKAVLDQRKDIRILAAEGQDVTQKALSADNLQF